MRFLEKNKSLILLISYMPKMNDRDRKVQLLQMWDNS